MLHHSGGNSGRGRYARLGRAEDLCLLGLSGHLIPGEKRNKGRLVADVMITRYCETSNQW